MKRSDFQRSVARATGESIRTIEHRGFSPLTFDLPEDEPVEPQGFDWEEHRAMPLTQLAA